MFQVCCIKTYTAWKFVLTSSVCVLTGARAGGKGQVEGSKVLNDLTFGEAGFRFFAVYTSNQAQSPVILLVLQACQSAQPVEQNGKKLLADRRASPLQEPWWQRGSSYSQP